MEKYPKYLEKGMVFNGWEVIGLVDEMNDNKKPSNWTYTCRCVKCGNTRDALRFSIVRTGLKECKHITDVGRYCARCGELKNWDEFSLGSSANGHNAKCKKCISDERLVNREIISERERSYRLANRDNRNASKREYYHKNKDWLNEQARENRKKNPEKYRKIDRERYQRNRVARRKQQQEYWKRTRELRRAYRKEYVNNRLRNDSEFRLSFRLKGRVRDALKKSKSIKYTNTLDLIGCTPEECLKYLNTNEYGYNFKDHGIKKLHIDHIIPCAFFDLTEDLDQLVCFNYKNLRLWPWDENIKKSDNLDDVPDGLLEEIMEDVLAKHPHLIGEA